MTIECLELISYQFVLENNVTIFEMPSVIGA